MIAKSVSGEQQRLFHGYRTSRVAWSEMNNERIVCGSETVSMCSRWQVVKRM